MFNPFDEKPITLSDTMMDWDTIYPSPITKPPDPYTKVRVILMNDIEVESIMFPSIPPQLSNNDLRRELAMLRRCEQQQRSALTGSAPPTRQRWKRPSPTNRLLST